MFSLGNWADKWTIKVQVYPDCISTQHIFLQYSSFNSLLISTFKHPQTWFGASFFILTILVFLLTTFRIQIQFPILEAFYYSFLVKVYGMMQYFAFLSFLPPLESFGLAAPIPVDFRVLGVETPLRT